MGEVEGHLSSGFDVGIAMELSAVVGGDGSEPRPVLLDQLNGPGRGLLLGARGELADQRIAAFALHQRHDAVAGALAQHRVDLPMPGLAPAFNAGRPFVDHSLAGEPAATVIGPIALTAALDRTAQMPVQATAVVLVTPDVPVDGLVADAKPTHAAQIAGHLLWAQAGLDQLPHLAQLLLGEAGMTA